MNAVSTPEEAAAGLIGLTVWGAELGHDNLLDLHFGVPRADDPHRGSYHIWIYHCAWRIEHGPHLGAGCYDPESLIVASLKRLNGRVVTDISFERPSLSTTFEFGDDRLITFEVCTVPTEEDPAEQWMLFRPDNLALIVGPGSGWRLSPRQSALNRG